MDLNLIISMVDIPIGIVDITDMACMGDTAILTITSSLIIVFLDLLGNEIFTVPCTIRKKINLGGCGQVNIDITSTSDGIRIFPIDCTRGIIEVRFMVSV